ncbi:PI31 proteasome regulator N-terminal-domain-containing protein [Dendryphion nanum]|uniref:PI31 proteasome regulator N-terminal-domain-containing protein n=1 Tax=Dendryphion nanum TaxID=256645 RepID=A0A9P9IC47_9PLEO|nr:PI31 proteasome regulator N-terminal-domain-containing protein [Dendryphion nanum]
MVSDRTAGNPLSAESLRTFMAASIPKTQAPQLKNAVEAVALAVHAGFIAVGFKLVGLGEDHRIDASADAHNPQSLPTEWNASSSYAFRYTHSQSSMEYLIKVNRLGGKAVVLGLAVGDDKTASFEVVVKDYLSESAIPVELPEGTSTEDAVSKLKDLFISDGRLNDLSALLKISIIQKLAPSLQKEGYEETRSNNQEDNREQPRGGQRGEPREPRQPPNNDPEPARPNPYHDPLHAPPRYGQPPLPEPIPGFEDEYEINRPPRGGLLGNPLPGGYGNADLYPPGLGPHDPLRPHFGGGGGLPRPGGGGMHPTFDDPLFGGGGGPGGYDPRAPPERVMTQSGPMTRCAITEEVLEEVREGLEAGLAEVSVDLAAGLIIHSADLGTMTSYSDARTRAAASYRDQEKCVLMRDNVLLRQEGKMYYER